MTVIGTVQPAIGTSRHSSHKSSHGSQAETVGSLTERSWQSPLADWKAGASVLLV